MESGYAMNLICCVVQSVMKNLNLKILRLIAHTAGLRWTERVMIMAKKYVGAWQTLNIIDRTLKKENKEYGITAVSFALERVKSYIQKLPAADVREVKHGRWIKEKTSALVHWHCSVCGDCYYLDEPNAEYCPRCGAKMDGEKGET